MPSKHFHSHNHNSSGNNEESPLLTDELFQTGINFNVKMIGSMDIPRPMTRIEIVAAMRRVRFEFKSKGIKKRKVVLCVGVDGVKTSLRVRKKKTKHSKYNVNGSRSLNKSGPDEIVLQHHPIYRIFYVSHDSQDVKIFSYIARETSSNVFHCCVFKASKKKQALRVVRTIGQAFEVSHKLNSPLSEGDEEGVEEQRRESGNSGSSKSNQRVSLPSPAPSPKPLPKKSLISSSASTPSKQRPPPLKNTWSHATDSPDPPSHNHQLQLLSEQLEQESLNTQSAHGQINLLREQLNTEMNARLEAESRNKQLLHHNKELLNHLQVLVQHIQELEGREQGFMSENGMTPLASAASGSPQLTPRSKIERWFVLSSGEEIMESKLTDNDPYLTSTESGFVESQANLFSYIWSRVKPRRSTSSSILKGLKKRRQRSVITV